MNKATKILLASLAIAGLAAPLAGHAESIRTVACSVSIDYLANDVLRAPYQKDFVVTPGVTFQHDFSTFTRFRFFEASTKLEGNRTVVSISYYNDVGVFEYVDMRTSLPMREDVESTSGSHTYWTELGIAGTHTTNWTLTCQRVK